MCHIHFPILIHSHPLVTHTYSQFSHTSNFIKQVKHFLISAAKVSIFRFHDSVFSTAQKFSTVFFAFSLRFRSTAPVDLLKGRGLNVVLAKVRQRHGEGSLQRCRTFDQLVDTHERFSGFPKEVQSCRSVDSRKA